MCDARTPPLSPAPAMCSDVDVEEEDALTGQVTSCDMHKRIDTLELCKENFLILKIGLNVMYTDILY